MYILAYFDVFEWILMQCWIVEVQLHDGASWFVNLLNCRTAQTRDIFILIVYALVKQLRWICRHYPLGFILSVRIILILPNMVSTLCKLTLLVSRSANGHFDLWRHYIESEWRWNVGVFRLAPRYHNLLSTFSEVQMIHFTVMLNVK